MTKWRPFKPAAIFLGALTLHAYGLYTVLLQVVNVGITIDEPTFWDWGMRFLAERDPFQFVDHPPLAMWWGALLPKLLQNADPIYFRIPHAALFFAVSFTCCLLLWRKIGAATALVFATFVNFDPYLKAMAALHITDSDATWWFALFTLCLFSFWLAPEKRRWLFFAAVFWGLALSSKISALFYAPFLLAYAYFHSRSQSKSQWHIYVIFCGVVALAVLTAYLGNWRFPTALKDSLGFSMAHNRAGHITSLFGSYSNTGYWYYFLILFLVKTPLATLATATFAVKLILWDRLLARREVLAFLLPGLFLLVLLSRANAQVGYRYFLPGLVLFYIVFAIAIGRILALRPSGKRLSLLFTLFVGAGLNDFWILRHDSYLTSFNSLARQPYRNFTEANVDWHQGIPKHLSEVFKGTRSTNELYDFLLNPNEETTKFRVGASELVYFWGSSLGMHLRALQPIWSRAGFEVYQVSKEELYRMLAARAPSLPYTWKTDELKLASRTLNDDAKFKAPLCPDGQRTAIHSRQIFGLDSAPVITNSIASAEFEIPDDQDSIAIFRNPLGGQLWINGIPVVDHWRPTDANVDSDYWIRLRSTGNKVKWQLVLPPNSTPNSTTDPQKTLALKGAVLWHECLSSQSGK